MIHVQFCKTVLNFLPSFVSVYVDACPVFMSVLNFLPPFVSVFVGFVFRFPLCLLIHSLCIKQSSSREHCLLHLVCPLGAMHRPCAGTCTCSLLPQHHYCGHCTETVLFPLVMFVKNMPRTHRSGGLSRSHSQDRIFRKGYDLEDADDYSSSDSGADDSDFAAVRRLTSEGDGCLLSPHPSAGYDPVSFLWVMSVFLSMCTHICTLIHV